MKFDINLYRGDIKPKLEVLTLPFVSTIWLVALILILAAAVGAWQYQVNVAAELKSTQQEQQLLETQLTAYSDELANRRPDIRLVAQVQEAESALQRKQALLEKLNDKARFANHDYPALMTQLAQTSHPKLWLSRISVDGEQVFLQGLATDADVVPQWITGLTQSSFLRGVEFEQARIEAVEDSAAVQFTLGSELKDHKTGSTD